MTGFPALRLRAAVFVLLMCGVPGAAAAQGPVISPSTPTVLAAGPDFATDVLANPWDFSDANDLSPFPDDIVGWTISGSLGRSIGRTAYLQNGKFVGTTAPPGNNNFVTLLYRGGQPWVPSERDISGVMGHQAIPTSRYGKLSVAMTVNAAADGPIVAYAYSSPYLGTDERSRAVIFNVARPGTHIYTVDLATGLWTTEHGVSQSPNVGSAEGKEPIAWQDVSLMRGFALRPVAGGDSRNVEIDWVRLTQRDGVTGAAMLPLQFTGCPSQEYNVEASTVGITPQVVHTGTADADGDTTASVNYGVLPPGAWNFQVRCYSGARGGSSTTSAAVPITINQPPIVTIHSPDAFGGADFAADVLGNPWDMDAPTDIQQLFNVVDAGIVVDGSGNALQGTGTNGDPAVVLLDRNAAIDTTRYTNLTFSLTLDTPFGLDGTVGDGSMARVFWSTPSGQVSVSRDLLVWPGRNLYTIDLSQLSVANGGLEPGSPHAWGDAPATMLRIDPHEATKNVRFRLGPTHLTTPDEVVLGSQFAVQYAFADSDSSGSSYEARFYRASSRLGPRTLIEAVPGVVPDQLLQYHFDPVARGVAAGEYFLYVEVVETRTGMVADARGIYSSGRLRVLSEAAPAPSPVPGAPTLVPVQVSANPIVISWSAGAGTPPTSYTVAAGTTPGGSNLGVFPVGLQTVVSGNVPTNIPVYIRVTAHNAAGAATSNEITVQIGGAVTPPGPPVLTAAQVTTNPVTLAWAAGAGGAPTSYTLYAGTAPGTSNLGVFPMGVGTSISAVAPEGVRIYVRVVAANGAGQAISNEISFQVGGGSVPGPPTLHPPVVNRINGNNVSLSWSAPSSGGAPTSYVLIARLEPAGPAVAVLPVVGTSFSTVAPSGTYLVTVVGVNPAGQGAESNQVTVDVP
jgi:hypothetical protein